MGGETRVYEARYGWNRAAVRMAALCSALVAMAFVPGVPVVAAVVLGVLVGLVLLMIVVLATARPPALRIDPKGVTLGGLSFGPRTIRATYLPWSEVVSISLWMDGNVPRTKVPYLEVRHRAGPARPPAPAESAALQQLDAYLATQVPAEFVERFRGTESAHRAVTLWRLDVDRLRAAVEACAPEVHVFGDLG